MTLMNNMSESIAEMSRVVQQLSTTVSNMANRVNRLESGGTERHYPNVYRSNRGRGQSS